MTDKEIKKILKQNTGWRRWLKNLRSKIVNFLIRPRWIVDEDGDPGIAFGCGPFRIIIGYYKWCDTFIIYRASKVKYREAHKRELKCSYDKKEAEEWVVKESQLC